MQQKGFKDKQPFNKQNRDLVCWYGAMTFIDHFWNVLKLSEFTVEIIVHEPLFKEPEEDWLKQNEELAKDIHKIIADEYSRSMEELGADD